MYQVLQSSAPFSGSSAARCVECMDGSVVLLELLSRLVEVLDALAPVESAAGAAAPVALPCFRELVCDALNEALGLRGFLPLCISYITKSPLEELETGTFRRCSIFRFKSCVFHVFSFVFISLFYKTLKEIQRYSKPQQNQGGQ